MAITSLPTPPSRSDPENFPERADAFMAALPRFATEANALQEHVNEAAATVDQDAAAAALSRDAAAESKSQANQSAVNADLSRQAAAHKAGEAGASAQLAQQWATKMGAPVEGDGFSAKHYAQLAAIGAGLPVYMPGSVPSQNVGPIYIAGQGNAEWDAATGRYRVHSDIPVGAVAWWPLRSSIPAGQIPADGQTVSRATFPDLAAMVTTGKVPVVTEADWLADPLKRGSYTVGDGSSTIRLPDFNGQSSGAIGAVFQRGDGALSSGVNGLLQRDALQNITGRVLYSVMPGAMAAGEGALQISHGGVGVYGSGASGSSYSFSFDASRVARTAGETRPLSVSGVWTIQAFGTITNPGAADAAQLASDYAALNAALQTQLAFTIIYPNGGTEAAPASVAVNTRYVLANPFPGSYVICEAQLKFSDGWSSTGWFTQPSESYGTRASQLDRGNIIVRTGVRGITASPDGAGQATAGTLLSPVQSRVLVWKCKG
ncbi:phage tail protein [Achromobacter ruhlandii]|uniref:phage tail protein n=1 Tax=Achromobacter ruhlandii TaxID=72557 RepID=UPI0021F102BD|nr:phage tail protein [Achromobacter ruhlandii]MCV6795767.1 phage tail protein [Achromobacter ruhlandii]MCV6800827.1 phage tail protein [Achromobacter ruhlandii]MCV6807739.1 phage tail protein [Achromobacter ruhlandii]MCV6818080.1 phage tail protein [Achromobacter ruhlandii]